MLVLLSLVSVLNIIFIRAAENSSHYNDYKGAQVWRVNFNDTIESDTKRAYFDSMTIEFDKWLETEDIVDFLIDSRDMDMIDNGLLKQMNINKKVLIDDVQRYIENENNDKSMIGNNFNYNAYHGYESMYEHLKLLESRCRNIYLCRLMEFGRTYENRSLYALSITPNLGPNSKTVVIEGGIHAREWITSASVMRIADYLVKSVTEPDLLVPTYIRSQNWIIIPLLNPDGYEFSRRNANTRFWKKNRKVLNNGSGSQCIGVDLDRNFEYQLGASKRCDSPTYGGEREFSELESQAFRRLIGRIPNVHTYISFRSYGEMILHPWGYNNGISRNNNYLSEIAEKASGVIYKVDDIKFMHRVSAVGGSVDWAFNLDSCVCAYTVKLRGDNYGFLLPSSQIKKASQDAIYALQVISDECSKIDN